MAMNGEQLTAFVKLGYFTIVSRTSARADVYDMSIDVSTNEDGTYRIIIDNLVFEEALAIAGTLKDFDDDDDENSEH